MIKIGRGDGGGGACVDEKLKKKKGCILCHKRLHPFAFFIVNHAQIRHAIQFEAGYSMAQRIMLYQNIFLQALGLGRFLH